MTNSRYVRLRELAFDSFVLDCPVEIEKGALLLDTQNKGVLLQLRLNILEAKCSEISSVTIKIECFDDANVEIPEIKPFDYIFRDINLLSSKHFGDKTPISLNPNVRKVNVGLNKVTFVDGHKWEYPDEELIRPKQQPITSLRSDLLDHLKREINILPQNSRERFIYLPRQLEKYWLCTCGRPNKNDAMECCRCGKPKKWVFENMKEENIQKNLDIYKEKVRLEQERVRIEKEQVRILDKEKARQKEEERVQQVEERQIRTKKWILLLLLIMTIGVYIVLFFVLVILPKIKF